MNERGEGMEFNSWEFDDELHELMTRALFERNVEQMMDKVETLDLPDRIIHPSLDEEQRLMSLYVQRDIERRIQAVYDSGDKLTHRRYRRIALESFSGTYELRELQAQIINIAAMLKTAAQNTDALDKLRGLTVDVAKKEFMAELRVHHGLKKEDEWLQFFDSEVPAKSLDPVNDVEYMDAAEDSLILIEQERTAKQNAIRAAKELLGVNDYTDDMKSVLDITGDLITIHGLASAPLAKDETLFARDETVRTFIVRCNLTTDPDVQEDIVSLFSAFYPEV